MAIPVLAGSVMDEDRTLKGTRYGIWSAKLGRLLTYAERA